MTAAAPASFQTSSGLTFVEIRAMTAAAPASFQTSRGLTFVEIRAMTAAATPRKDLQGV
jgi:hypothetical protein